VRAGWVRRFFLKKCRVFGKEFDIASFVLEFKRMKGREKEEYILSVIEHYGVTSEEFYFVLQTFVLYVMIKHGIDFDEDVFQDAFVSVLEKVRYWEEGKGSLMSFLYSLIRDRVSYGKYLSARGSVREVSLVECDPASLSVEAEVPGMPSYGKDASRLRKSVLREVEGGEDSIYRRAFLWRTAGEMV